VLSEIIKKRIEEKSGLRIRSSRDCELLASKIVSESNCRLSASTLRRLFGFVKGTKEVRIHTLDVISNYLGYPTWDELIETFNKDKSSSPKIITKIISSKLKKGEKYQYLCKPEIEVTLEYLGKSKFKVLSAKNSQLLPDDIFTASVLTLHHPLFILEVERDGKTLGKTIEAKVSGVTSIKKL
jgi:hypothetical protein